MGADAEARQSGVHTSENELYSFVLDFWSMTILCYKYMEWPTCRSGHHDTRVLQQTYFWRRSHVKIQFILECTIGSAEIHPSLVCVAFTSLTNPDKHRRNCADVLVAFPSLLASCCLTIAPGYVGEGYHRSSRGGGQQGTARCAGSQAVIVMSVSIL